MAVLLIPVAAAVFPNTSKGREYLQKLMNVLGTSFTHIKAALTSEQIIIIMRSKQIPNTVVTGASSVTPIIARFDPNMVGVTRVAYEVFYSSDPAINAKTVVTSLSAVNDKVIAVGGIFESEPA